jgi:hypothetical protein
MRMKNGPFSLPPPPPSHRSHPSTLPSVDDIQTDLTAAGVISSAVERGLAAWPADHEFPAIRECKRALKKASSTFGAGAPWERVVVPSQPTATL